MKRIIQLISVWLLALMSMNGAIAQIANTWTGAGDGASWDDADNWSGATAPSATEVAVFDLTDPIGSVTITGTNTVVPAGLRVISDVSDYSKTLTIGANLAIGNGNNIDYSAAGDVKGSIQADGSGKIVVASGMTLTGHQAADGSRVVNVVGNITVAGIISIPSPNTTKGVQIGGLDGQLIISDGGLVDIDAAEIGIHGSSASTYTGDNILIESGGTLDIIGCTNRSIVLQDGMDLSNHGTVNVSHELQYGIRLIDAASTLKNNAGGSFTITNTGTGRSLESVAGGGSVINAGTLSFMGGTAYRNVQLRTAFTNELGGVVVLDGDNQIRLNDASGAVLTNNGLIKTTGSGYISNLSAESGTCVNNGFYKFGDGVAWPAASNGANNVDNGVRLFTLPGSFDVDAGKANPFDITLKAAHNWYTEATAENQVAATDATGSTTLSTSDCITTFYTSYGEDVKMLLTGSTNCNHTISFGALTNKTFGDAPFELSATSDQGLTVQFSKVSGPIEVSGTTVTITGAGTAVIAADQPGNETYPAAPQVTQSFEIAKADQTITVTAIADKLVTDDPFDVEASTTSGLELTYAIEGKATISGKTVTLTGDAGLGKVTVSQAGNDNYNAADDVAVTFNINAIALSAGDLSAKSLAVYPNPTADVINLDIPIKNNERYVVRILEMNGAVVLKRQLSAEAKQRLSVAHMERGLYLVEVSNGDEKNISKLIISDQ